MTNIETFKGNTLSWVQGRNLRRSYDLRFNGETIGKLRFEKAFGSLAVAETPNGIWTFKREGFVKPRVTVRTVGSDNNIAVYQQNWGGGGAIRFDSGQEYEWKNSSFWGSEWKFLSGEEPVLTLKVNSSGLKSSAQVTVETNKENIAILVPLSWYLIVLTSEDAAVNVPNTIASSN